MEFILTIRCDNAAFTDETDPDDESAQEHARAAEVKRILDGVEMIRVESASQTPGVRYSLLDLNGNQVGAFRFQEASS